MDPRQNEDPYHYFALGRRKDEGGNFFIFPHWVLGQCRKIITYRASLAEDPQTMIDIIASHLKVERARAVTFLFSRTGSCVSAGE